MKKTFSCSTCGTISEDQNQLCQPEMMEGNETCLVDLRQTANMCGEIKAQEIYTCESCGRPALEPERLCEPVRNR